MCKKTCTKCSIERNAEEDFYFHSKSGYYLNKCKYCYREEKSLKLKLKKGELYDTTKSKIPTKICITCNEEKLLNFDNFSKNSGSYSKECRECSGIKRDLKQRLLKEEFRGQTKICLKCNIEKDLVDNFYHRKISNGFYPYCIECEKERNKSNKKLPSIIIASYKRSDKAKGLETDLSHNYVLESLQKPCIYCGFESTGLDRIDNNIGHTESNTVPCCWECNTARMNNFTHEETFVLGEAIRKIKEARK